MSGTQKQFSRMITIGKNKIENQRKHTSWGRLEEGFFGFFFFFFRAVAVDRHWLPIRKSEVPPLYIFGNRLFFWGEGRKLLASFFVLWYTKFSVVNYLYAFLRMNSREKDFDVIDIEYSPMDDVANRSWVLNYP